MAESEVFKVAIVGSGPAGLSAGARAATLGLSHVVLEKTDHASDTIYKFQKGKFVMSTPDVLPLRSDVGFDAGSREGILDVWNKGLSDCNVNMRYKSEVTGITGSKGNFEITINGSDTIKAENVVLAIGLQGNINKLRIPGAENPHIQYQLDDPDEYEHERIIVIGAGDASIENAVALASHNTVYIANRGTEFARAKRGNELAILEAIDKGQITPLYGASSARAEPGNLTLDTSDGEITVECDRVIARLGAAPPRKFVEACGVEFPSEDRTALPEVSGTYESNVDGLHVVGALGGYPLIKQAMNQGYEVIEYINGNTELEPADQELLKERLKDVPQYSVAEFVALVRERLPIFAELNPLLLREMLVESTVHSPAEGDIVFEKNDYTNSFYTIVEGSVRIHIDADNFDNYITIGQGAFFGEMGLISGRRRTATISSNEKSILIETPRRTMIKMRNSVPSVRRVIDREAIIRQIQSYIAPGVSRDDLKPLADSAEIKRYKKGEVIFKEGDDGDALHLIRKGSAMVTKRIGGRDVTLNYQAAGSYFGEMALMAEIPRTATVTAAVETETVIIEGEKFINLMNDDVDLYNRMDELYGTRLIRTEQMAARPESGSLIEFLMDEGVGEATDVLLIDESICVGCDNCEKACAETHGGVSRLNREAGPSFANVHIPTSCRHCEHPHCMTDCPPDAIKRSQDGEVYISDACIGCGNCVRNCPYGVVQLAAEPPPKPGLLSWLLFGQGNGPGEDISLRKKIPKDARKTAVKCDMCKDIAGGASCVRACPTGAAIRVNPNEFMQFYLGSRGEAD